MRSCWPGQGLGFENFFEIFEWPVASDPWSGFEYSPMLPLLPRLTGEERK